jgi:hypothetical protein
MKQNDNAERKLRRIARLKPEVLDRYEGGEFPSAQRLAGYAATLPRTTRRRIVDILVNNVDAVGAYTSNRSDPDLRSGWTVGRAPAVMEMS